MHFTNEMQAPAFCSHKVHFALCKQADGHWSRCRRKRGKSVLSGLVRAANCWCGSGSARRCCMSSITHPREAASADWVSGGVMKVAGLQVLSVWIIFLIWRRQTETALKCIGRWRRWSIRDRHMRATVWPPKFRRPAACERTTRDFCLSPLGENSEGGEWGY